MIDTFRGIVYVPNLIYVYIYEASILTPHHTIRFLSYTIVQANVKSIIERHWIASPNRSKEQKANRKGVYIDTR